MNAQNASGQNQGENVMFSSVIVRGRRISDLSELMDILRGVPSLHIVLPGRLTHAAISRHAEVSSRFPSWCNAMPRLIILFLFFRALKRRNHEIHRQCM